MFWNVLRAATWVSLPVKMNKKNLLTSKESSPRAEPRLHYRTLHLSIKHDYEIGCCFASSLGLPDPRVFFRFTLHNSAFGFSAAATAPLCPQPRERFCDSLLRFKELLYHSLRLAELDRALTQVLDCHPSVSIICLIVYARHGMHSTLVTISLLLSQDSSFPFSPFSHFSSSHFWLPVLCLGS